ncbi:MAG: Hsp20/alpha crystallin family protein [Desulfovibrionaceae bacterium]|jgi:HSP20 family protein|nr:Hsp20/alpha crystallin family protein [Desulfovibrionaceae bacterium]
MGKCIRPSWLGIDDLTETMDRLMRVALEPACPAHGAAGACGEGPGRADAWRPAADVCETDGAWVLRVDLPGVRREDVVLEARGRELALCGVRRAEDDARGGAYRMLERACGPFRRSFLLPPDVDGAAALAVLADGVLTVTLPRRGRIARRIDIDTE